MESLSDALRFSFQDFMANQLQRGKVPAHHEVKHLDTSTLKADIKFGIQRQRQQGRGQEPPLPSIPLFDPYKTLPVLERSSDAAPSDCTSPDLNTFEGRVLQQAISCTAFAIHSDTHSSILDPYSHSLVRCA